MNNEAKWRYTSSGPKEKTEWSVVYLIILQLRRVTWWTRNSEELPVLSDESEFDRDDSDEEDLTPEELDSKFVV